jgi:peptidoglycan/LPS O-acetylase OafA/YrhL
VTTPRHLGLDGLRAVAVLLVIGRHLEPAGNDTAAWLRSLLRLWRRGGWVGVDLFFVLSGFLVAGLLLRAYQQNGRLDLGRFYLRRSLKIYPAFYLFLALTLPLAAVLGLPPVTTPAALLSEGCFLQSYLPGAWNHTWSLAVEEHFYLLLPLGLALLLWRAPGSADPFRQLGMLSLVLAGVLLVLRVLAARGRAYDPYLHHFPTHLRLDALGLGVAIAYYYHFHGPAFQRILGPQRRLLMLLGIALLAPAFFCRVERSPWVYTFGLSLFALGSVALVCGLLLSPPRGTALGRGLAVVGAHSYSIYLWHMPVILWGPPLLERCGVHLGGGASAAWAVGGSLAVGMVMARLIELPVLRWRDRRLPAQVVGEPAVPARAALAHASG